MPHIFNVGDRVKCIDASWSNMIEEGVIYTVAQAGDQNDAREYLVKLAEVQGRNRYRESRFELVAPVIPQLEYKTYQIVYVPDMALADGDHWQQEIAVSVSDTPEEAEREEIFLNENGYKILAKKLITIKYNKPEINND